MTGSGLRVPPPVMYIAAMLIGIGLDWQWPVALALDRWGDVAGIVLIVAGVAIMLPVLLRFRRGGTGFNPHKPPSALITDGPYRFSRNPPYIALTLWYLGAALLLNNGWVLLLAVPVLLVMDRQVIPAEKRHLEAKFGEQYQRYKAEVRRWL